MEYVLLFPSPQMVTCNLSQLPANIQPEVLAQQVETPHVGQGNSETHGQNLNPVIRPPSTSIDPSARFDNKEKLPPAIAPPQHRPRGVQMRRHRCRRRSPCRYAVSGSAGSIPWIRNHKPRRERDARPIRCRERELEDRPQSFPPRVWDAPPDERSSPAKNLCPECEQFPARGTTERVRVITFRTVGCGLVPRRTKPVVFLKDDF